jgi:hypothetical protein
MRRSRLLTTFVGCVFYLSLASPSALAQKAGAGRIVGHIDGIVVDPSSVRTSEVGPVNRAVRSQSPFTFTLMRVPMTRPREFLRWPAKLISMKSPRLMQPARIRWAASIASTFPFLVRFSQDRLQRKDGYRKRSLCGRIERNQLIVIREAIGANEDILPHTVHDHSVILLRVGTLAGILRRYQLRKAGVFRKERIVIRSQGIRRTADRRAQGGCCSGI